MNSKTQHPSFCGCGYSWPAKEVDSSAPCCIWPGAPADQSEAVNDDFAKEQDQDEPKEES